MRSPEKQLTTALLLLVQFESQINEYEAMNRAARRTPRGRDLSARIDGLRQGHATWTNRVEQLRAQIAMEGGES